MQKAHFVLYSCCVLKAVCYNANMSVVEVRGLLLLKRIPIIANKVIVLLRFCLPCPSRIGHHIAMNIL